MIYWQPRIPLRYRPMLQCSKVKIYFGKRRKFILWSLHSYPYSGRSAVKLSLQSFKDSYYYTNDEVNRIPELKSYLEGRRLDQSPLAVKVSIDIYQYLSLQNTNNLRFSFPYKQCKVYAHLTDRLAYLCRRFVKQKQWERWRAKRKLVSGSNYRWRFCWSPGYHSWENFWDCTCKILQSSAFLDGKWFAMPYIMRSSTL